MGRTAQTIAAGAAHTCALLDNNALKCWGSNSNGQFGLGDSRDRGDNPGEMGDNLPAIILGAGRTAQAIATGGSHTCALLDNNALKCWGSNSNGQLGLGDTIDRGDNFNETGDNLPAIDLGTGRTALAIATGFTHTCALLDNNSLKCWGSNSNGQLGLGDSSARGDNPNEMGNNLPAIDLGTGRTALAVAAGVSHTCARLDNNSVKCWGFNNAGQLGLGDTDRRGNDPGEMGDNLPAIDLGTGRTALAIAAGDAHTCARLDDNSIKCWGKNSDGQLGLGDSSDRGDAPNEMGNNLLSIDLGTGHTALAIATGFSHTCARLDDNSAKCWGLSSSGQLGIGRVIYSFAMVGDNLPAIDLGAGRTAQVVATGGNHTCARLDNNLLKCWGNNSNGQLGYGDTINRGDNPDEMGD
jgi:alpha-tubulin suppressor-like RCC1 family protein